MEEQCIRLEQLVEGKNPWKDIVATFAREFPSRQWKAAQLQMRWKRYKESKNQDQPRRCDSISESPRTQCSLRAGTDKYQQTPALSMATVIEQYIQSVGGTEFLNVRLERPRFDLLKDACNIGDHFYVALHQMFCLWDLPGHSQVSTLLGLPDEAELQGAFDIIGQLLWSNNEMAPNHKIWFARFPCPFEELTSNFEPYRKAMKDMGTFLSRLPLTWAPFANECRNRGFPPLMDELENRIGLSSPTLQGVVFTAARRDLGFNEEVGKMIEDLFLQDRKSYHELVTRANTGRPPTVTEVRDRNSFLINEYRALYNQYIQHRSSSRPVTSRPTTTFLIPALSTSTGLRPIQVATAGSPSSIILLEAGQYPQVPDRERATAAVSPTVSQNLVTQTHDHGFAQVEPQRSHLSMQQQQRQPPRQQLQAHSDLIQPYQVTTPGLPQQPLPINQIKIYHETHPLQRSLVPPLGFIHPPQPPNPDMTALHQAHLHSPRLVPYEPLVPKTPSGDSSRKFYQVVKGFALSPTRLSGPLSKFDFSIPMSDFVLIARDRITSPGQAHVREFKRGTLQYRLRCVQRDDANISIPDWIVSDTTWPESACISINDRHLEIRLKFHHGKDLPIDITQFIVPTSADPATINRITVSNINWVVNRQKLSFFLAIEIIEAIQHDQIVQTCKEQEHIPAEQTLHAIKKTFAPLNDDDDVAIVISDLSINLADPFTKRIFEIPVRGNTCLHRDCFDLETFLQTRESKVKWPDQPCIPDVWKCPLCGRDARPGSLRIDDFFASVRDELQEKDMLHVTAIQFSHDGPWRPIEGPKVSNGKRKAESDENTYFRKRVKECNIKRARVEVIDLSDG